MARRESLICEGHGSWSGKIAGLQFGNLKAGGGDQIIDLAVEMTITREPPPNRCQAILPGVYPGISCASMLQKNKRSTRPENAPHLFQRLDCVGNRTQCPC